MWMGLIVCVCVVISPYSFAISDTSSFQPYLHGGIFRTVKTPKTYSFVRDILIDLFIRLMMMMMMSCLSCRSSDKRSRFV